MSRFDRNYIFADDEQFVIRAHELVRHLKSYTLAEMAKEYEVVPSTLWRFLTRSGYYFGPGETGMAGWQRGPRP